MITYLTGDATHPTEGTGKNRIIAHCCNNIGAWGAGFVLALNKLSPKPKARYRAWATDGLLAMKLGMVQIVNVQSGLYVANMVGQEGIYPKDGKPPIRYEALEECLSKVAGWAVKKDASLHMPRIGCGLAGGDWAKVEEILLRVQQQYPVEMFVYDLPEKG